jgi:hypothetical protein
MRRLTLLLIPVLFFSIPFLVLPLFSLRSIGELEDQALKDSENNLALHARTLSGQISELITAALAKKPPQKQPPPQTAYPRLTGTMRLDGLNNDWPPELATFREKDEADRDNLSYRYYAGIQGRYLYLLFEVRDDHVIYRATDTLKLDESDHLQIIVYSGEEQKKYIAAGYKPGWIVGFEIPDDPDKIAQVEKRIHGNWKSTDNGYVLEARIDRALLGDHFSLAIADVDDTMIRAITTLLDTSAATEEPEPKPRWSQRVDLNEILKTTDPSPAGYRVRVIDENLQILAETGSIGTVPDGSLSANPGNEISNLPHLQDAFSGRDTLAHYRDPLIAQDITAALSPLRNDQKVVALVSVEQIADHSTTPIDGIIGETILLFVTTYLLSSGGVCLFLLYLTRSSAAASA